MRQGREVAVVLVGHGSARHPDSAQPIHALASALAERRQWQTAAVFMKQAPKLEQALSLVDAPTVVVVPVFAGQGYYTDQLIPQAMALAGPVTRRGARIVHYTAPVGTHPRIPVLLASRAAGVAMSEGMSPKACSLLIIAHGSARPGGSGATPRAICEAIRAMGIFGEVALAFLEQEPYATDWRELVGGTEVLVLPLLVAQGMHASEDIPPLFGMVPGQSGPVGVDGRRVRLAAGLGSEPELVEIIAAMVEEAVA